MADTPQYLTLKHHRDGAGRRSLVVRRVGVTALAVFALAGLANLFGQRPSTSTAATAAARLDVYVPARIRGGLYYEARFHVHARTDLKDAILVLDTGWMEGMTINTIEPSPVGEASRDGKLSLDLGHVAAGQSYLLFVQLQVNPTNVGHRPIGVSLYDGDRFLTRVARTITVFP